MLTLRFVQPSRARRRPLCRDTGPYFPASYGRAGAVPPEGSLCGGKLAMLSFGASYACRRPCHRARSILSNDARSSRTDELKDEVTRESGRGTESLRETAHLP